MKLESLGDGEQFLKEARALLGWYRLCARALPWRSSVDPWAIWVSEVMLQQTQVTAVLKYYDDFMGRFPTVESMALAAEEEVLSNWSGLGYYNRARRLWQGAREVVRQGGEIPRTAASLRELPGVGQYTAAAIASIAFGESVPVLDGNVERVLTRWLALSGDPKRAAQRRELLSAARLLLVDGQAGDSNQALMELGAMLCKPREPDCGSCPLRGSCRALAEGDPTRYPTSRAKVRTVSMECRTALVRRSDERYLLFRRSPEAAVLPSTWEFPWVEAPTVQAATELLSKRYGGSWRLSRELGRVRHAITFRRLVVTAHEGEVVVPSRWAAESGWFNRDELTSVAVSSLVKKVLDLGPSRQPRVPP